MKCGLIWARSAFISSSAIFNLNSDSFCLNNNSLFDRYSRKMINENATTTGMSPKRTAIRTWSACCSIPPIAVTTSFSVTMISVKVRKLKNHQAIIRDKGAWWSYRRYKGRSDFQYRIGYLFSLSWRKLLSSKSNRDFSASLPRVLGMTAVNWTCGQPNPPPASQRILSCARFPVLAISVSSRFLWLHLDAVEAHFPNLTPVVPFNSRSIPSLTYLYPVSNCCILHSFSTLPPH